MWKVKLFGHKSFIICWCLSLLNVEGDVVGTDLCFVTCECGRCCVCCCVLCYLEEVGVIFLLLCMLFVMCFLWLLGGGGEGGVEEGGHSPHICN